MATTGKRPKTSTKDAPQPSPYDDIIVTVGSHRFVVTSADIEFSPMGHEHLRLTAIRGHEEAEVDVTHKVMEGHGVIDHTLEMDAVYEGVRRDFLAATKQMAATFGDVVQVLNHNAARYAESVARLEAATAKVEELAERVDELAHNLEPE